MIHINANWGGHFITTIRQIKVRISSVEKPKEKESLGRNHAQKFLVHNGTMDKFRFRQSVKFWVWEENKQNEYFWRKANTKRIFGIKLII